MKIIFRIFLVLILLAVVGSGFFIYKHTDGCNSEFKTFYVEYNGHHLPAESSDIYSQNMEYKFDIVYPFGFIDKEQKGYDVKVIPNANAEAVLYVIDDRYYSFRDLNDITSAFKITKEDDSFTLSIPKDFTIKTVLEKIYPDKTIEIDEEYLNYDEAFYTLIISSYNGANQYTVNFGIVDGLVKGVSLDITKIEF